MIEPTAREIIKRISGAAIELAIMRSGLTNDDGEDLNEEEIEAIKTDVLNCLTGDDCGCLDRTELNAKNCELLWVMANA